ncbi:MAG: Fe-S oxidoreductase, partial [Betaproteobacteria bacterium]
MDTVAPIKEISDLVKEKGGASFQFCYQCGICDVVCPWNRVRPFSMR